MKRSRRDKRPKKRVRAPKRETKAATLVGELKLHRDGYGFVIADKLGVEDVFVPARFIGDALHTDLVEVKIKPGRGGKQEGVITKIVERRVKKLVGRLENYGKGFRVVALDNRVRRQVKVLPKDTQSASHGEDVVVIITGYPEGDKPMCGVVEKTLEGRGTIDGEEEVIITHHQLPTHFPKAVEEEARRIAEQSTVPVSRHLRGVPRATSKESETGRKDLTNIPFITIDGESAQDFDDAIAAKRLPNGMMRLWVSIADVSHYVKPGSLIDREAYERATSTYFPQRCLSMLPEVLSNDLCSLRPGMKRFTMTAELDIDTQGKVMRRDFYRSVIKSHRRMTYKEIKQILVEEDPVVCEAHVELIEPIRVMEDCFKRLRVMRLERGSLDFDLPEPEIIMDLEGDIDTIVRAERHIGHMMIEEFMIAANEAVAEALTKAGNGCIYRVHEHPAPEKIREFAQFVHNMGIHIRLSERVPPKKLAKVIEKVRDHPEERIVNHKLLRSMAQAVYSPENLGHYGLASTCYCHFTSPIRRYPDLVVHRLLTAAIADSYDRTNVLSYSRKDEQEQRRSKVRKNERTKVRGLAQIAEHCSRRERRSMEAERQMAKLYAALFMRDHVGSTFDGVVSHIAKFGFFVELIDYFVEGVVPLASLEDDYYRFDEQAMRLVGKRSKRIIRIGDSVRITVEKVSITDKEIDFELVNHG